MCGCFCYICTPGILIWNHSKDTVKGRVEYTRSQASIPVTTIPPLCLPVGCIILYVPGPGMLHSRIQNHDAIGAIMTQSLCNEQETLGSLPGFQTNNIKHK